MKRIPQGSSPLPKRITRRGFLDGIAVGSVATGILGCGSTENTGRARRSAAEGSGSDTRHQSKIGSQTSSTGLPGPFPGRVVEVGHVGSVHNGRRNRAAIKQMIDQGLQQLVPGAGSPIDGWRHFFQKGDRVGIKVVMVGMDAKKNYLTKLDELVVDLERPGSISSYEVVLEVIDGLRTVGVKLSDIMVFDRYRDQFIQCGYDRILPRGVHWECCSSHYDLPQLEIDGQLRGLPRADHVAGYDRDVFRELAFCQPAPIHAVDDDRRFRSKLTKIITQKVDKVISIPVLKDHRSSGVTLSLKNMSHGMLNNVARTHLVNVPGVGTLNQCLTFIPAAVSLAPIREKCVLQILDAIVATYEGGPGIWNGTFSTWEHQTLLFATDPVALDHVGWKILDAKRAQEGWPPIAQMGLDAKTAIKPGVTDEQGHPCGEQFHIRQPQHVPLAATLGLGLFDPELINHQRFEIG